MVNSLLDIKNLKIHYSLKGGIFFPKEIGRVKAVDDVTFSIYPGETFSTWCIRCLGSTDTNEKRTSRYNFKYFN